MTMSISWQGLSSTDLQFKRYIKMRSISIANTHHDVKTFKVDGTVNKKKIEYLKSRTWLFHEVNYS